MFIFCLRKKNKLFCLLFICFWRLLDGSSKHYQEFHRELFIFFCAKQMFIVYSKWGHGEVSNLPKMFMFIDFSCINNKHFIAKMFILADIKINNKHCLLFL